MNQLFPILQPYPKARRSDRVSIEFPIEIMGIDAEGASFSETTKTMVVSRYGCCLGLSHRVNPDQKLEVSRLDTHQHAETRVVGPVPVKPHVYALETSEPCDRFWGIRFSSSEDRLTELLEDGIYFVDRDRRITFWSDGAEKISGYSAGQAVGKHCYNNLLNHVDQDGRRLCVEGCPLSKVMIDGEPREMSVFLQDKDGNRTPVLVRAQPIRNNAGQVVGAVEVFSRIGFQPAETSGVPFNNILCD
jgi:PAS domain S-box-containing protein